MSTHLIVAKYKEDTNWIKDSVTIPNLTVFLYNKDETNIIENSIPLPNIGREAHTYLTYIINNYNNLGDINVFCQGNPVEHYPTFFEALNNVEQDLKETNFKWLTDNFFECDFYGGPNHHIPIDIVSFLSKINVEINTARLKFGPGAQFAVKGDTIKKHSVGFYKNILNQFAEDLYAESYKQDDIRHNKKINQFYHLACIMERTWELIITST